MIYTLTFNPALDYVIQVDHFKPGKVNRVSTEEIVYGGKGINVSALLKALDYESKCLGFVAGFTGKELVNGVEKSLGLNADFIEVEEGMTRINTKLFSDEETEINGKGPVITAAHIEELMKKLDGLCEGDVLILSGSIPSTVSQTIYSDILQVLAPRGIHVVVDATGKLLTDTLQYRPFLIKPNNHELAEIFDVEIRSLEDVEKYARELQKMGARNVLISMAKDGSLLVDEQGSVHVQGVCKGQVVNSVGAGDSMVGGFVAGYLAGKPFDEVLKLATACGGATAFSKGIANREKIEEMLAQFA